MMLADQNNHNPNTLALRVVTVLAVLTAMVATTFVFAAESNPIAASATIAGVLLFVVATIAPRSALFLLIPITFSLDFVKRLLVVFSTFGWSEVASVLSVAPLIVTGILAGCVLRQIFRRRRPDFTEKVLLGFGSLMALIGIITAFKESAGVASLKVIANESIYFFLPWAALQCFSSSVDIERYLKTAVIFAIPVALYGIYQYFFGLNDFELAYISTGYAPLMAFTANDVHTRPFSTLNSTHAYSVVISFMLVCAFYVAFLRKQQTSDRHKHFSWQWGIAFLVLLFALLTSSARGAILGGAGTIFLSFLFASRTGTRIAYVSSIVVFVSLVVNAENILEGLDYWQKYLPSEQAWQEQAFRLGTISNRLMGYRNVLTNPSVWPLIANPIKYEVESDASEALHAHDAYSAMILKYGILPVAAGLCLTIWFAIKVHSSILRLPKGNRRNFAATLFSIIFGFMLAQTGGIGMQVFPINYWMCLFCGFVVILCFRLETQSDLKAVPSEAIKRKTKSRLRLTARH